MVGLSGGSNFSGTRTSTSPWSIMKYCSPYLPIRRSHVSTQHARASNPNRFGLGPRRGRAEEQERMCRFGDAYSPARKIG